MNKIIVLLGSNHGMLEPLNKTHLIVGVVDCSIWPKKDLMGKLVNFSNWLEQRFKNPYSVYKWAKSHKTPYIRYHPMKQDELTAWLSAKQPDALITSVAPLLSTDIINIPRYGTINTHYSSLPEYRGGSPILWQLMNDETNVGITIHLIDEGIDTGPIIYQTLLPLQKGDTQTKFFLDLDHHVSPLLPDLITKLCNEGLEVIPQPDKKSDVFARNLSDEQLKQIIQWDDWEIERVWAVLRYLEYWPDAFATANSWKRFLRWKVAAYHHEQDSSINGFRMEYRGSQTIVRTRNGFIDLQPVFSLSGYAIKIIKYVLQAISR